MGKHIIKEGGSPEKRIVKFFRKHHVLTLATAKENIPWCANCFYVYDDQENKLIFTSDETTRHIAEALFQNQVSGSVVLETKIPGKIQGIQFSGIISKPDEASLKSVRKKYLKRFPYARLMETTLWTVRLTHIKMTDNRLGFGTKLIWQTGEKENR